MLVLPQKILPIHRVASAKKNHISRDEQKLPVEKLLNQVNNQ